MVDATKPTDKEAVKQAMEAAADEAWKGFNATEANATGDGVKAVANWLKANYLKAGYKALCRRLITIAD